MEETAFDRHVLSLPGFWLRHDDRDWAGDIKLLLDGAVDQFNEALVAFDLFKPFTASDIRRDADGVLVSENFVGSRRRTIYARAFVYALDSARSFVHVVAASAALPVEAKVACETFLRQFGYIRDIRNSLQHVEDRLQAKGPSGKKLPGPLIVLGSLNERRFGATGGDGRYVEVDISEEFIARFRSALSAVLWAFEWLGPGEAVVRRPGSDA